MYGVFLSLLSHKKIHGEWDARWHIFVFAHVPTIAKECNTAQLVAWLILTRVAEASDADRVPWLTRIIETYQWSNDRVSFSFVDIVWGICQLINGLHLLSKDIHRSFIFFC